MNKNNEEERLVLAKLKTEAKPADPDTEIQLMKLADMAASRRKNPDLEKRYEALRELLATQLTKEGPRYFLGEDGIKRYAYAVTPEPVEVSEEKLMELDEAGKLKAGVLEKVAPRKVDKDAFRRAVANGSITREQFLEVAELTQGTKFVKFSDPIDNE